jgi:3-oxoacyl-[acyl-carrier protein] reductase
LLVSKALSQLGKRDGVNVNVIHPGAIETERFYQLLEQRSKASGKSVEHLKQEATAKDGLRRLSKLADIAALALFLCSQKAGHIQGTAIAVDGGSTVGYY